jgi:membrane protease YdiL (CAAX protease family)
MLKTLKAKIALQLSILACLPLGMLIILASMVGSCQEFAYLLSNDSPAQNLVIFLGFAFFVLILFILLLFTPLQLNKKFRLVLFGVTLSLALFTLLHGFLPALASAFAIYYIYRWYHEIQA